MLENTPVYVPKAWVDPEPDRNDGNCEEPYDCLGTVVDFTHSGYVFICGTSQYSCTSAIN